MLTTTNELVQHFVSHPSNLKKSCGHLISSSKANKIFKGRTKDEVQEAKEVARQILSCGPTTTYTNSDKVYSVNYEKGTVESSMTIDYEPKDYKELALLHKIDLTKYKIANYWSKLKTNGKFTSSVLATKIKVDSDPSLQKDILIKEIKSFNSSGNLMKSFGYFADAINRYKGSKGDQLLEISIPDLHLGKLAHKSETNEDYDLKIAVDRFKKAIEHILTTANLDNVSRILLPIGNDLINVDNELGTTTAGTPQDCDSRFSKMITVAKELLVETITGLSALAPVDVIIVPGNHDQTITFLIGEILDAWFHGQPNIHIDNDPKLRKYYQFGENGFMYTHGDKEAHKDLGLIFATENSAMWAATKYRFVKLGHFHKQKKIEYLTMDSHQGFQVEILPSLSGTDYWHHNKGYIGNKQAKGYLYDKKKGEIAQFTYTV